MRNRLLCIITLAALFCGLPGPIPFGTAEAWGEKGHLMISRVAAEKLPADAPEFLRAAADRLSYLGPEPDRWRDRREFEPALNDVNAPDHFIDIDRAEDFQDLPDGRYAYIEMLRHQGKEPKDVGFLPYAIMENFQKVRVNFRLWREARSASDRQQIEQNIITYAGILGHYVADGSQPLHASDKFNGWRGSRNPARFSRETTIHARFETEYVDARVGLDDFRPQVAAPKRLADPFADIMAYLLHSHSLVEQVYRLDQARRFDKTNTDAEAKKFVVERIAAGSHMLASLWYTAWLDSAR